MNTGDAVRTSMLRVLMATCALLLVPAVAMQFTSEVRWGAGDFLVAGGLIFLTGIAMVTAWGMARSRLQRAGFVGVLALVFLLVWAELAVGVFS